MELDMTYVGACVACATILILTPSKSMAFATEVVGAALTVLLVVGSGVLAGTVGVPPFLGPYEEAAIMCSAIVLIDRFCGGRSTSSN